mmetsp:Transcript_37748/g.117376  ORF Transcript_37748/g.117376 Transcript_37748/m.117376 type:complete len:170 (-) Transcript_37748:40-549(-)
MGAAAGAPFCDPEKARGAQGTDELRRMAVAEGVAPDGERINPWSRLKADTKAPKVLCNCMAAEDPPGDGLVADSPVGCTVVWRAGGFAFMDDQDSERSWEAVEGQDIFGVALARRSTPKDERAALPQTEQCLGPASVEVDGVPCGRPLVVRMQRPAPAPGQEGSEACAV